MSETEPSPGGRRRAAALSLVVDGLLRAVAATCRFRWLADGERRLADLAVASRPAIFVVWHDRIFLVGPLLRRAVIRRGRRVSFLVSRSQDGEIGARVGERLGGDAVRGSTSRGGSASLRRLLRDAAAGHHLLTIPDGPLGPPHQAKPGTLQVARLAGIPIVPLSWAADRTWHLRSWDRMEIPKPFSRVTMGLGEPFNVPRELPEGALEAVRRQLDAAIDRLGDEVRRAAGRD